MSPDPLSRAGFSFSMSLFGLLVERGVLGKDDAIDWLDRMISTHSGMPNPDTPVIDLMKLVREYARTLNEPTRN